MYESVTYDKKRKVVVRRFSWEEVHDDGTVEHHYSESIDTNRQRKYVRCFTEELRIALKSLDKNSADALMYIIDKASRASNVAAVTYKKLESYLGITNQSVNRIMQLLQEKDLIRMVERGQWMYNPKLGVGCYDDYVPQLNAEYYSLPEYARKKNSKKQNGVDQNVSQTNP